MTSAPANKRSATRHAVAFPGLLKIMRPEQTFTPMNLPVLILDIATGGAMIRLHPTALREDVRELQERSFVLKVANSDLPSLRGSVVWLQRRDDGVMMGLRFHLATPAVEELARRGRLGTATDDGTDGVPPPPVLHPWPTTVHERRLRFSGEAYRAQQIEVRDAHGNVNRVPVKDGQFEVEVTLEPERENRFAFVSSNAMAASFPVEASVSHRRPPSRGDDLEPRSSWKLEDETEGARAVALDFSGTGQDCRQFLRIVSALLREDELAHLEVRMKTDRELSPQVLQALTRRLSELGESGNG